MSQPATNSTRQGLYDSLRNLHYGRSQSTSLRSCPPSPSPSLICRSTVEPACLYGSVSGRTSLTPPLARRYNYNPSPAGPRKNWIQRHNRRPNTVNIDENTMSGNSDQNITKYNPNLLLHNPLTNNNMIYSPATVTSHAVHAGTYVTGITDYVGCRYSI